MGVALKTEIATLKQQLVSMEAKMEAAVNARATAVSNGQSSIEECELLRRQVQQLNQGAMVPNILHGAISANGNTILQEENQKLKEEISILDNQVKSLQSKASTQKPAIRC